MDRCNVVWSVLITWAVIGAIMGVVLVLGGCSGYPRYDPGSCWATEYSGDGAVLWECK